jgi:hypothetical protein
LNWLLLTGGNTYSEYQSEKPWFMLCFI